MDLEFPLSSLFLPNFVYPPTQKYWTLDIVYRILSHLFSFYPSSFFVLFSAVCSWQLVFGISF